MANFQAAIIAYVVIVIICLVIYNYKAITAKRMPSSGELPPRDPVFVQMPSSVFGPPAGRIGVVAPPPASIAPPPASIAPPASTAAAAPVIGIQQLGITPSYASQLIFKDFKLADHLDDLNWIPLALPAGKYNITNTSTIVDPISGSTTTAIFQLDGASLQTSNTVFTLFYDVDKIARIQGYTDTLANHPPIPPKFFPSSFYRIKSNGSYVLVLDNYVNTAYSCMGGRSTYTPLQLLSDSHLLFKFTAVV